MKKIQSITVVFEDGTTRQWVGVGTLREVVTEVRGDKEGTVRYITAGLSLTAPPPES